jgi:hypothetical protein
VGGYDDVLLSGVFCDCFWNLWPRLVDDTLPWRADWWLADWQHALMLQDPLLKVVRQFSPMRAASLKLSPQGDPHTFDKLDTPFGRPFDPLPPGHTKPVTGSLVNFIPSAHTSKSGIFQMIVGVMEGTTAVGGTLICPVAWWKKQRTQAELLQELKDAFPRTPTVWLEESSASCCTAAEPVLRCVHELHAAQ